MWVTCIVQNGTDKMVATFIQDAAEKSNPLLYLVDIPTTNLNVYKKIYTAILQSYNCPNCIILIQHLTKLCYLNRDNPTFYNLRILCLRIYCSIVAFII